jgi:hypothetical protein
MQILMHWASQAELDDTDTAALLRASMETQSVPVPSASSANLWAEARDILFIDDRHERACAVGCSGGHCTHVFREGALRRCARLRHCGVTDARPRYGQKKQDESGVVTVKGLHAMLRRFWEGVMGVAELTRSMQLHIVRTGELPVRDLMREAPVVAVALLALQRASENWREKVAGTEHEALKARVQALNVVVCGSLHVCARAVCRRGGVEHDICSEQDARLCVLSGDARVLYATRRVAEAGHADDAAAALSEVRVHCAACNVHMCVCVL